MCTRVSSEERREDMDAPPPLWSGESVDEVNRAIAEKDPIFLYTLAFNDKELGHALKSPARAKERFDYRGQSVHAETVAWHSVETAVIRRVNTMAEKQQPGTRLCVDPEINYRHVALCAFAAVRSGEWQVRFGSDNDHHLDGCTAVDTAGFAAVSWRHLLPAFGTSGPSVDHIEDCWRAAFPLPLQRELAVEHVIASTSQRSEKGQYFMARVKSIVTYEPALVIQRQKIRVGIAHFLYLLFHRLPAEGEAVVARPRLMLSSHAGDFGMSSPEEFAMRVRNTHLPMAPVAACMWLQ
jgi:hypothetical protein